MTHRVGALVGRAGSHRRWSRLGIMLATFVLCAWTTGAAGAATPDPLSTCTALAGRSVDGAQVTTATAEPTGSLTIDGETYSGLPAFCRVTGVVDATVQFEDWLPARRWNSDLETVGNGGYGGTIDYSDMAVALQQGYATASTDTGHPASDAGAFISDPVSLEEWGRTSIHLITGPTKAITGAYYARRARYAYFVGGSTGGDQAMAEAEFYPADYNGIVARSPGLDYAHLVMSFIHTARPSARNPAALIGPTQQQALSRAVLEACASDKAVPGDEFLTAPRDCHYDPGRLACHARARSRASCLTPAQLRNARQIYAPVTDPANGMLLYPGFNRGTETQWSDLQTQHGLSLATVFAQQLFGRAVYDNPNWALSSFDFASGSAVVDATLAPSIDATSPDLRAFAADGGKLIMTQGWDDPLNAAGLPIEYYDEVVLDAGLGTVARPSQSTQAHALSRVQRFFRLFMQPGVGHVVGGPGPSTWSPISVIRAWVQDEHAPSRITASLTTNTGHRTRTIETRPWCAYPRVIAYDRHGSTKRAASFRCAADPIGFGVDLGAERRNIERTVSVGDLADLPN